jgi:hypothetical protein
MLWLILLAITARIMTWRKAEIRRRQRNFRERIERIPYERRLEFKEPVAA